MGLFYKVPAELKALEALILAVGQEMASLGRGYGNVDVLNEMMPDTIDLMHETKNRLLSTGREGDLKSFRKHVLSVGKFMDNGPYNKMFYPFIRDHLGN